MRTWRDRKIVRTKRLIEAQQPDFSTMSVAEIAAWEPPEPDPYALFGYPLQTKEWRQAFLHDYYWVGETALFIAVAHVWATLAPSRADRCTLMGAMSGTGGAGKAGLVLTLKQFLEVMLAVDHPIPKGGDYPTMEAWNVDAMAAFAADEADRAVIIARYEAILDGRPDAKVVTPPPEVIVGPWLPTLDSSSRTISVDDR